jgi:hypothetical protein
MYDPRDDVRDDRASIREDARQNSREGRDDARDRADDPRAVHALSRERERLHDPRSAALEDERGLTRAQQRVLVDVAAFRVIRQEDLVRDDSLGASKREVRDLLDRGLVLDRASHREGERYLALSREGVRYIRRCRPTRKQSVHAGFARRHLRDRGLRHDAAVYRACRAESARQDRGVRVTRISLDVDLRADLQGDIARQEREVHRHLTPEELALIAERYQVAVTREGRIQYPDAQLEFERDDRSRFTVGVEVTTDDYRSGAVRAKREAGYSMYHLPSAPGGGVPSRVEGRGAPVRIQEYELWAL